MSEASTPKQLVEELAAVYRTYFRWNPNQGKGLADLLSGWFRPPGSGGTEPEDEEFVASVKRIVANLAKELPAEDAEGQDSAARSALEIMIQPPETYSEAQKLFFCAVQEQGVALTPFLRPESRADLCRLMRQAESPRRQLPSQRSLFRALGGR